MKNELQEKLNEHGLLPGRDYPECAADEYLWEMIESIEEIKRGGDDDDADDDKINWSGLVAFAIVVGLVVLRALLDR